MKGIIYTRVSSDEQVKGTSLETQERACIEYCQTKGIEVLKVFREEGESAKTADRKEFLNALDFCKKNEGKIDAFVVWKLDRFSRNAEAHFHVKAILSKYRITLHSVTEPIGSDPAGKVFETILAAFAEFDNAIRRQRCMNGMAAKLQQGLWAWKPPVGYLCAQNKKQDLKKTEPDKPNPETFPIIQKALKEYAKGLYSQADIARMLERDGLNKILGTKRISLQVINKLLGKQLPFYAGLLVNPWLNASGDNRLLPGLHEPMITQDEMLKIQQIRSGKKVQYKWDRLNPNFPLRRTVLCASCNRPLTGSTPKGNGGAYNYYHCFNKECPLRSKFIAKEMIESEFAQKLESITPTEDFLKIFKATVIDYWKEQGAKFEFQAEQYKAQVTLLEKQRSKVFEMREDGSYSTEEFRERRDEIEIKLAAAKISYSEARIEQFDIEGAVNYAADQIGNLPRLWKELAPTLKPRFQKLVFPQGIAYQKGEGFRTAKLGCIYEINRHFVANKSTVVDPRRFELLTPSLQMRCSTN